ncbi:hypothetical protein F4781DRAFT_413532, partial [Annulohypoxylon bovei var. microspora]
SRTMREILCFNLLLIFNTHPISRSHLLVFNIPVIFTWHPITVIGENNNHLLTYLGSTYTTYSYTCTKYLPLMITRER